LPETHKARIQVALTAAKTVITGQIVLTMGMEGGVLIGVEAALTTMTTMLQHANVAIKQSKG